MCFYRDSLSLSLSISHWLTCHVRMLIWLPFSTTGTVEIFYIDLEARRNAESECKERMLDCKNIFPSILSGSSHVFYEYVCVLLCERCTYINVFCCSFSCTCSCLNLFLCCVAIWLDNVLKILKKRDTHTAHGFLSWAQHIAVSLSCAIVFVYLCVCFMQCVYRDLENQYTEQKSNSENIYKQELKAKDESAFCEPCMCGFSLSLFWIKYWELRILSALTLSGLEVQWKHSRDIMVREREGKKCTQRHSWQSS